MVTTDAPSPQQDHGLALALMGLDMVDAMSLA